METSYRRALSKAISRAQRSLEADTDFFEDHSTWENPWVVESEHYEVRTTDSRRLGKEVAEGLETMRGYFEDLLGKVGPTGRGRIYIYPDRAAYNAFGDQFGEHHSSILGGFYAGGHPDLPVATYLDSSRTRSQMWITHCALHQFLAAREGAPLPVWLEEGLASYFALFWDFTYGVRELEALKRDGRLLDFNQLMGEDISAYTADPHARFIQLGMVFTYLLRYCEETRQLEGELPPIAPFQEFIEASVAGDSVADLAFTAFINEEGPALQSGFLAFDFEQ